MKNFIICLLFTGPFITNAVHAQNMAINTDGSLPDASAMVDVASTTRGFLAPRMTTTQQNTISLPAKGLLIYNTTDNQFKVNIGTAAAPVWTGLTASSNNWLLTGNSGTNASSNFLGTTDNINFGFRTNNTQRMVIDAAGRVGIGIANPANPLVVKDTFEIRRTGSAVAQLLFANTSGTGDFRIGGDGGDIFWQGGGGRTLQMGSFWGINLAGDRQVGTFPSYIPGAGNTGVLVQAQRDASVPLAIQSNSASQSANLTEWRNAAGTVLNVVDKNGSVAVGTASFNATNPEKLVVDAGITSSVNAIVGKGNINNYLQLNIQNNSSGTSASSDVVATANNGDETTNYVDMGINGGGNTNNIMGGANDGYLYTMGNNFLLGTGNASKSLVFMTGGTSQATNERMRIDGTGNVGIGVINPAYKLQVSSSANPLQLTGLQTGSNGDSVLTVSNGVVRRLNVSALATASNGWGLTGNATTNPSTNFIGTTDAQALVIKENNTQVGRFEANSIALGNAATTNNSTQSYSFGSTATVGYNKTAAMALGNNSAINADSSFALGTAAVVNGTNSFAIGNGASANNSNSMAIGKNAVTAYSITDAIAIGTNATTNFSNAIAIGSNTTSASKTIGNAASAVAIGNGSVANSTNAITIGTGAGTGFSLTNPVAIGANTLVNGSNGIAIGNGANISYISNATVLGAGASATNTANNSTAIGYNTDITKSDEIILGDMTNTALSVGIGSEAFSTTNKEKLLVDAGTTTSVNAIAGKGSIDSYLQLNIQNNSAGTSASSDVVATANNGNETSNYVDMGINGGNYTGGVMGAANDGYLYTMGNNFLLGTGNASKSLIFMTGGTAQATNERMRIDGNGKVGIGLTTPTAMLHLKAGTATANTAPLKLTSGINLTTPEDGAVEYNGTHFYGTIGSTRYQLDQQVTTSGWNVTGNAATAGSNFLGTTNNVSLRMRTNNLERMVIDSTGKVGIGTAAPLAYLDINNNGSTTTPALKLGKPFAGNGNNDSLLTWNPADSSVRRITPGSILNGVTLPLMLANGTVSATTSLRDYNAWVSQKTYGGNFVTDAGATISNPIPNEGAWFALSNVATYPNSAGAGQNYFGQTSLNDHNFYFRGGTVNTSTGVVTSTGWQKNLSIPASSQTTISIDASQNATFNVTDNAALKIRTNNIERMVIDSVGDVRIGSTAFNSTNPEQLLVDAGTTTSVNAIAGKGSIDSYLQLNIQNNSAGTSASSDVVATANNGNETSNYVDMGINGGNYTGSVMGAANDGYLYTMGNNFLLGTGNASKSLIFMTGGTTQATNERMRINGSGNVGIGTVTPTSTLHVAGSVANAIVTKTATYTATASDYTIVCNNSGAITINLPAASGVPGRIYVIKKISGALNNVTIDPNASETIDGVTTKVLMSQYESAMIQSDGTSWYVLANN